MDLAEGEASPLNAINEELDILRKEFHLALDSYARRIDSEIIQIQTRIEKHAARRKIPPARLRDVRDILTLLRKFQIKPEKGRRRDLKKIDALIGDLQAFVDTW